MDLEYKTDIKNSKSLTQIQAEIRSKQLSNISYKINLTLEKGDNYSGSTSIDFNFIDSQNKSYVLLDFSGKQINELKINGQAIEIIREGVFIIIPISNLNLNQKNNISVNYNCKYNNDGCGLHSFIDASENNQYIYSQSFLFFANRIIPCFDQPDLKATFQLDLTVPIGWVGISNSIIQETIQLENNNQQLYKFQESTLLPTYLFGLTTGPFKEIKCEKPTGKREIPMSIYCRQSHLQYLKKHSDFIFNITIESLKFYEEFFGRDFAFPKYDQIFCPEFNWGAMENAGMVIYTDNYVFKENVDSTRILKFANTIAHELSHHWFGNLVTMKWWNDLWLNESFADFISHFCLIKLSEHTEKNLLKDAWLQFNSRKQWAYQTDEKPTTHSISGECENTEYADGILDGITYTKGASVLKNLFLNCMGEGNFSEAMKTYFQHFSFKNASLNDLIQVLDNQLKKNELSNFSVSQWKQEWLCTAGPNILGVQNLVQNGNKIKLIINQKPVLEQYPQLRTHVLDIGVFYSSNSYEFITGNVIQPQEITELNEFDLFIQGNQVQGILLNYGDKGYCKTQFDPKSLEFFIKNVSKIGDQLTRTMIWNTLYDMVRNGKLSSQTYIDCFIDQIKDEKIDSILQLQFQNIQDSIDLFTPQSHQQQLRQKLFDFSYQWILQFAQLSEQDQQFIDNQSLILILKSKLVFFAATQDQFNTMIDWFYSKNQALNNQQLGGSNRWNLVYQAHTQPEEIISQEQKQHLLKKQLETDNSEWNQRLQEKCQAVSLSDINLKEQMFNSFIDKNNQKSPENFSYQMQGFCSNGLQSQKFDQLWLQNLEDVFQHRTPKYATVYFTNLFPKHTPFENLIPELQKQLNIAQEKNMKAFSKKLLESLDLLQKRQKAYDYFNKN